MEKRDLPAPVRTVDAVVDVPKGLPEGVVEAVRAAVGKGVVADRGNPSPWWASEFPPVSAALRAQIASPSFRTMEIPEATPEDDGAPISLPVSDRLRRAISTPEFGASMMPRKTPRP